MLRQLHSTRPASPTPCNGGGHDGEGSESSMPPTEPANAWPPALASLPSFSSFARGQHSIQIRPRMRRRDARPASHKQKLGARSSTAQESTHEPTQSPSASSFSRIQSTNSHGSDQPRPNQQKRPCPLHFTDDAGGLSTSVSPPSLPSPPISAPSIARSHKDIEQLADNFSRHRLDLASRRTDGRPVRHSTRPDGGSSSLGHYNYKMAGFCMQAGGNAPVADLEVDITSATTAGVLLPAAPASTTGPPTDEHVATENITGNAASVSSLPLSLESLALPHHTPIHNDVPSSGYDLKGWLESSSTVEVAAGLVAGTVGSNNMTSIYFTASPETIFPHDTLASVHRHRSKPPFPAPVPSYLDKSDPVDLADGPNPPVGDLEVDMIGNGDTRSDPTAVIAVDVPESIEAAQRGFSPFISNTSCALAGPIFASHAQAGSRHIPLSQRIHMAHMEVEREALLRRANRASGSDATAGGYMDVEMRDPATLGFPSGGPSVMGGSWLGCASSLRPDSPANGVRKHMGPLRYHLSAEVAMRCTNLVHSKPRMRRRQLESGSKSKAPASVGSGSSIGGVKEGSVRDSVDAASAQGKCKDRKHRASTHDRRNRASRRREVAHQASQGLLARNPTGQEACQDMEQRPLPGTAQQTGDSTPPFTL